MEPALPLLLLLALVGIAHAWRISVRGRRPVLLTVAIAGILLLSTNCFAWFLSRPLEAWYDDAQPAPLERPQAIVVLAGTTHSSSPNQPYVYAAPDTYRRLQHTAWLYKHWNSTLPILVCGGRFDDDEPYSHSMRRILEATGVPPDLIWIEDHSHSTHENALYGSQILRKHGVSRIALVVEANSMWRAGASFKKYGIAVLPAPMRFSQLNLEFTDIVPSWQAIALNGEHVHELVGLLWYRLRGWI